MSTTRNTVVIGIDGTEDGDRALYYGLRWPAVTTSPVKLVHVVHQAAMYAPMLPYLPETHRGGWLRAPKECLLMRPSARPRRC